MKETPRPRRFDEAKAAANTRPIHLTPTKGVPNANEGTALRGAALRDTTAPARGVDFHPSSTISRTTTTLSRLAAWRAVCDLATRPSTRHQKRSAVSARAFDGGDELLEGAAFTVPAGRCAPSLETATRFGVAFSSPPTPARNALVPPHPARAAAPPPKSPPRRPSVRRPQLSRGIRPSFERVRGAGRDRWRLDARVARRHCECCKQRQRRSKRGRCARRAYGCQSSKLSECGFWAIFLAYRSAFNRVPYILNAFVALASRLLTVLMWCNRNFTALIPCRHAAATIEPADFLP